MINSRDEEPSAKKQKFDEGIERETRERMKQWFKKYSVDDIRRLSSDLDIVGGDIDDMILMFTKRSPAFLLTSYCAPDSKFGMDNFLAYTTKLAMDLALSMNIYSLFENVREIVNKSSNEDNLSTPENMITL
jgi:hypothetical protein